MGGLIQNDPDDLIINYVSPFYICCRIAMFTYVDRTMSEVMYRNFFKTKVEQEDLLHFPNSKGNFHYLCP